MAYFVSIHLKIAHTYCYLTCLRKL